MALLKIKDYNSNYIKEIFGGEDIKGYDVYAGVDREKIGSVKDILVDEVGHFRYVVIDTGFWVFGKKVLLPIGRCRLDYGNRNLYAIDLTKEQVEALPEYDENTIVDYDYEERVRTGYRTPGYTASSTYDRNSYDYDYDRNLYDMPHEDRDTIRLYQERLIADKERRKAGEVSIGKNVVTETARASIPVEKEQVIIERRTPTSAEQVVAPGEATFREGEVARVEVYEETANLRKEAVVSEEVTIRKEVEHETVTAEETLRREELDVDVDGKPIIRDR